MPMTDHIFPTQEMDTSAMRRFYPTMTGLHGQRSLWIPQAHTLVVTLQLQSTQTAMFMWHTGTMATWT